MNTIPLAEETDPWMTQSKIRSVVLASRPQSSALMMSAPVREGSSSGTTDSFSEIELKVGAVLEEGWLGRVTVYYFPGPGPYFSG